MTRRQPEVCSEGSSPNQRLKLTGAAVLVSVVQRFSRRPRQFSLAVGLNRSAVDITFHFSLAYYLWIALCWLKNALPTDCASAGWSIPCRVRLAHGISPWAYSFTSRGVALCTTMIVSP
jgi:hypothetical protein